MTLSVVATPVPTGGAIMLDFTIRGSMTPSGSLAISRAVSGSGGLGAFSTIYSGAPVPYFPDIGVGLPGPLSAGSGYVYQAADQNGSVQTTAVFPAGQIVIEPDGMTETLIRLLQGGVDNVAFSPDPRRPKVLQAMPMLGDVPILPVIVVNLDLIQQREIPIGQEVVRVDPGSNPMTFTIAAFARRVWTVSVLADNAISRDYWRNTVLGIFHALLASVFQPLGRNIRHEFQAATGQMADERKGFSPGFYYADVMLTVEGTFSTTITSSYGLINTIIASGISSSGTIVDVIQLPLQH